MKKMSLKTRISTQSYSSKTCHCMQQFPIMKVSLRCLHPSPFSPNACAPRLCLLALPFQLVSFLHKPTSSTLIPALPIPETEFYYESSNLVNPWQVFTPGGLKRRSRADTIGVKVGAARRWHRARASMLPGYCKTLNLRI